MSLHEVLCLENLYCAIALAYVTEDAITTKRFDGGALERFKGRAVIVYKIVWHWSQLCSPAAIASLSSSFSSSAWPSPCSTVIAAMTFWLVVAAVASIDAVNQQCRTSTRASYFESM